MHMAYWTTVTSVSVSFCTWGVKNHTETQNVSNPCHFWPNFGALLLDLRCRGCQQGIYVAIYVAVAQGLCRRVTMSRRKAGCGVGHVQYYGIDVRSRLGMTFIKEGGVVYSQRKGGGSVRFQHSGRSAWKWRPPNLREAGRTIGNPMLGYAGERLGFAFSVFLRGSGSSGSAVTSIDISGRLAAQVIGQAKQTKFGFNQVYSSAPHLLLLTESRSLRGGHLHDLINFFPRAFEDSRDGWTADFLAKGCCMVQMHALRSGPFVASLFCETRQSHQAHEHNNVICLIRAVAILRRTTYCAETGRFLPFFWRHTTPPYQS